MCKDWSSGSLFHLSPYPITRLWTQLCELKQPFSRNEEVNALKMMESKDNKEFWSLMRSVVGPPFSDFILWKTMRTHLFVLFLFDAPTCSPKHPNRFRDHILFNVASLPSAVFSHTSPMCASHGVERLHSPCGRTLQIFLDL